MLIDLLLTSKPRGPKHLLCHYDEYARLVVDTVFSVSRDIKELNYLVGYSFFAIDVGNRRIEFVSGAHKLAEIGRCNGC